MFRKKPDEKTGLDRAIDDVFSDMEGSDSDSPEYAKMVDQLVKLHALKVAEKQPKKNVDANTLVTVAGNLMGVGMILGYEKFNVVTSKALGMIIKPRV